MRKIALLLVSMLSFVALGAGWEVGMKINGDCLITKDGVAVGEIKGCVFRPVWRAQGFTGFYDKQQDDGIVTVENRSDNDAEGVLALRIAYRQEGAKTLVLEYSFTPSHDMRAHSINSNVTLGTEFLGGKAYKMADGTGGIFPVSYEDKTHIARTQTESLSIESTLGTFQLRTEPTNTVLIQDNRTWKNEIFEFRMSCKPDNEQISGENVYDWKGGKTYKVSVSLEFPEAFAFERDKPVVMAADDTWIPLTHILEIEAGSALDFTDVVKLDAPAGKHGWTKAVGQNFEFSGLPSRVQRFYGVNFCMGAHILTKEECDRVADRLARFGYNTVRFHHHENPIIAQKATDSSDLDPKRLDAIDYLFAALKKRGIYITTDVYVSRNVRASEIYPGEEGMIEMNEFKQLCAINANAMASWKRFAKAYLGHKNPYTGMTLAEDPALNLICMVNEGVIGSVAGTAFRDRCEAQWIAAWNAWLAKEYPTVEERQEKLGITEYPVKALPSSSKPEQWTAYSRFRFDTHQAMYKEMTRFLREELKSGALFSDMNNSGRQLWAASTRGTFDYVDDHFYIDHPRFLVKAWRLPSTSPNKSVIKTGVIGGSNCAYIRHLDRPFTITEWNYCGPGPYRGIGGIATGCLAALQNWAGLWRFSYSHSPDMFSAKRAATYFDVVADPFAQLTDRATICLFLRGDIGEATKTVAMTLDRGWVDNKDAVEHNMWMKTDGFSLTTKVGTYVGPKGSRVPADVSFGMSPDAPQAKVHEAYQGDFNTIEGARRYEAVIKGQGLLPKDNRTDLERKIFQTPNKQFLMDGEENLMVLDTPMTAGGFAEVGKTISTGIGEFAVEGADATVWVSSVTSEPIRSSRRLLLNHVTELHNTGQEYGERARSTVLRWGGTPHLMKAGSVKVRLDVEKPNELTVYRLDMGGKRLGKVETRLEGGKLAFELNVKSADGAQMLYELIR